jgi:hypothetical protein
VRSSVFLGESTDFLVDADGVEIRARVSGVKPEIGIGDRVVVTLPSQGLVFARKGAEPPLAEPASGPLLQAEPVA